MAPDDLTYPCDCCGELTLSDPGGWEVCPVCNREDDHVQAKFPGMGGDANDASLNEARAFWRLHHKPLPPNGPR